MPVRKKWRVAGINFDFHHMDHLLSYVHGHPGAEIVGISHTDLVEMQTSIREYKLPPEKVFTDWQACIEQTKPDLVILCPRQRRPCRLG